MGGMEGTLRDESRIIVTYSLAHWHWHDGINVFLIQNKFYLDFFPPKITFAANQDGVVLLISKEITAHLCHDHMASPGSGEGKLNVKRARKKRISQNTTLSVSLSFVYLYKRIMDFFAAGCSIFAPY